MATGTLPYTEYDPLFLVSVATGTLCKGKPPVATVKKDEPWALVVSVATGTLPYTEYDPPLLLSTLKVIWPGSDSPRAGLLGLLWVNEPIWLSIIRFKPGSDSPRAEL